jgi:3'-phosphoadenosine 5'-phosphosulfate sulfotransferase (PAPS reductase)/FAD synthetase
MKRVVGFSGGADSQATALWVRKRFAPEDVILVNIDPGGNEAPATTEFIEWYSTHIFPVTVVHSQVCDMAGSSPGKIKEMGLAPTDPLTFDLLAELKGCFPSTKVRFCTTHLKLEPMRRWCYENGARGLNANGRYGDAPHLEGVLSEGYERYAGVRRDESKDRALVDEREYDDYFSCWLNRPLATWTKKQVFDYLVENGEPFNPLYLLGFGRIGCAPCINSGKEDILLWNAHFPAMIEKIERWEKRVGRSFFPPVIPTGVKVDRSEGEEEKAFRKRKRKAARRHGFIREVVEWAKTVHGGRQIGLPLLEADVRSGMCMSKYGLCE